MKLTPKIIVVLLLSYVVVYGQEKDNLVLNPSFESIDGKLKKLKQINVAKEWDSPTALKADLFSKKKEMHDLVLGFWPDAICALARASPVTAISYCRSSSSDGLPVTANASIHAAAECTECSNREELHTHLPSK